LLYQHHQLLVIRCHSLVFQFPFGQASLKLHKQERILLWKFHNVISVRFQKWISYWFVLVSLISCFSILIFWTVVSCTFSPSNNTFLAKLVSEFYFVYEKQSHSSQDLSIVSNIDSNRTMKDQYLHHTF
jgi:hypothetical protein